MKLSQQATEHPLRTALLTGVAIAGLVVLVAAVRRTIPEGIRYLRLRRM